MDIKNLLIELIPYDMGNYPKIRLGSKRDGGYIILNFELEAIDTLYSYGVGNNVDFELDFVNKINPRTKVKLYDHTIHHLPKTHLLFSFKKEGINSQKTNDCNTLTNHIYENKDENNTLLLKMDVEGAESDSLLATPNSILKLFKQIIIEIHDLAKMDEINQKIKLLKKINQIFYLYHIHPNNHSFIQDIDGYKIPNVLELSYIRKLPHLKPKLVNILFPTKLDQRCSPTSSDVKLGCWPFQDMRQTHRLRAYLRKTLTSTLSFLKKKRPTLTYKD